MAAGHRLVILAGLGAELLVGDARDAAAVTAALSGVDAQMHLAAKVRLGVGRGVPMSTPQTCRLQLQRLQSFGFRVRMLPVIRDVDSPADAAAVAMIVPDSRFGRLYRPVTSVPHSP